jgi:hypothetical protein
MRHESGAPPNWGRKYFESGGGDAGLLYVVFGDFPQPMKLDAARYRTNGAPEGTKLSAYGRDQHGDFVRSFYEGWLGRSLRDENPALFAAVEQAPTCLLLRGTVPDPPDIGYLRDAVGLLMSLLNNGGVALVDCAAFAWFSPQQWKEKIFEPNASIPRAHVSILVSTEDGGAGVWVHTRGLRKFGRPDLSLRGVPPQLQGACIELCNRFIEMLAFGAHVPEGQAVRIQGLPAGMTCHHEGDYDDPDFNNVHIEIRPPW